jgi:ankyrin repeat protein/energy-coupling factor transporter ATP-binding protein EcfA2
MADPLTALGLAASIVQFISFTSSLISKTSEISNTAQGATVEIIELKAIATNITTLNAEILPPSSPRGNDKQSRKAAKSGELLRELCTGCEEVSKKLLDVLEKLECEGGRSKWKSFRQALKTVWKESEIEALSKRLERYRGQIDTALLVSLRYYIQERESAIDTLTEEIKKGTFISRISDIKTVQLELADILESREWQLQSPNDFQLFSSKVSESADCGRQERAASQILEKLRFRGMDSRFENIPHSYQQTFNWILEDNPSAPDLLSSPTTNGLTEESVDPPGTPSRKPRKSWNSFSQWLRGDQTLYWITGKPGSGKSTLMKHLSLHHKTMENLAEWTGTQKPIVAGFFFWNSGTAMQMSEMGLFQSLLYQAVKGNEELLPTIFPERWRHHELFGTDLRPWSLDELSKAFEIMVSDSSRKFFFFVDGLDEFSGSEGKLAKLIVEIVSSRNNIKMCVASRPWLAFEDAFYMRPSLRLEDLTSLDIQNFVAGNLGGNRMFSSLQKARPHEATSLILEITQKACGVFLWVHLVVLSLWQGLQDGDSIADLRERLLLLPSDLENLFEKIIGSVSPTYLAQACMIFQCLRVTNEPLSLLDLSLAQETFDEAMAAEVKPMDATDIQYRAEATRRRLNSRCRGLIEAPDYEEEGPDAKIQYLHRTVKDFLATRHDWEIHAISEHPSFHPDLALCSGYLLHLKVLPRDKSLFFDKFWRMFNLCLTFFDSFREEAVKGQNNVIDRYLEGHLHFVEELQRVGDETFDSDRPDGKKWLDFFVSESRDIALFNHSRIKHWHESPETHPMLDIFPKYAIKYELVSFVKSRLKAGCETDLQEHGPSLLHKAVVTEDVHLAELLLQNGVNPNSRFNDTTVWQNLLARANHSFEAKQKETWVALVLLFLKYGAKPRINVNGRSAKSIIQSICPGWDESKLDQLLGTAPKLWSGLIPGTGEKTQTKKSISTFERIFKKSLRRST